MAEDDAAAAVGGWSDPAASLIALPVAEAAPPCLTWSLLAARELLIAAGGRRAVTVGACSSELSRVELSGRRNGWLSSFELQRAVSCSSGTKFTRRENKWTITAVAGLEKEMARNTR